MKEFQEKRKLRKIIFSRYSLIVLLIILIILSISTAKVYLKSQRAVQKNQETIQKIQELEEKKRELEEKIAKLQTQSGMEEELMEKFSVKKQGEEVLNIIDKSPENDKIDLGTENHNIFSKIWNWLKNIF